ncbi:unnamed protein product [Prunus armeniaca]
MDHHLPCSPRTKLGSPRIDEPKPGPTSSNVRLKLIEFEGCCQFGCGRVMGEGRMGLVGWGDGKIADMVIMGEILLFFF